MKNKLFLFSTLLLSISVTFAQNSSNLVVFSEDAAPFYLFVNGIKQNAEPKTNIRITGLSNPSNAVLVIFEDKSLGTLKQNFYFHDMGVEVTGKIVTTKKGMKLRYFGEIPLNEVINNGQYTVTYQTTEAKSIQPVENSVTTGSEPVSETTQPIHQVKPVKEPELVKQPQAVLETTEPVNEQVEISNSNSVNLNYIWTSGKSYLFSIVQTDDVNTSMMGMNMKDRFTTKTDFEMFISYVDAQGTASGILYLNNFQVTDSRGAQIASLNDLPTHTLRSDFTVDSKGNFNFPKRITLLTTAQGNVLAYGKVDENTVQTGVQAGDLKIDAYAEFDPKTGKLKTGYTLKENQPTRQVSVKMDENSDVIDVLPYDYLSMLALPEGPIAQGDKAEVSVGIYKMNILAQSIRNGMAQINYKMSSDKSKNITDGKADIKTENSNFMMDMPMMDMMELDAEDKAAMDFSKSMMPDMNCNIDSYFDYKEGMFSVVKGTITTTLNTMGLKMEVKSSLEMKKL